MSSTASNSSQSVPDHGNGHLPHIVNVNASLPSPSISMAPPSTAHAEHVAVQMVAVQPPPPRVFIPGILPAPRCPPPAPQAPPPPSPLPPGRPSLSTTSASTSASAASTSSQHFPAGPSPPSSASAHTESSTRQARPLISVLRRSATTTTDLATPAISQRPATHLQHHAHIVDQVQGDSTDVSMRDERLAAAAEGPQSRAQSQQRSRSYFRSASAPNLIPSYSTSDLPNSESLSSPNSASSATDSNSSVQDSDLPPTPHIPLTPERVADHTPLSEDDVANSARRRESGVSTCPTFQTALASPLPRPHSSRSAVSPDHEPVTDQPANYGTITDLAPHPDPAQQQQEPDQRTRYLSASATLTTTPSVNHSNLSLHDSLPTHSSCDRTLAPTGNHNHLQPNMRKSPSSLLRTILSPCLSFASTCTHRTSSVSTRAEPTPLQVAYASQVLLRWHRPHHAGDADARKSRKESKMVFWREYRAYLLVDPTEHVNEHDQDAGTESTRAQIVFCDIHSLSATYPLHTLPLHSATLSLHAPSDLSLSIHPSPASSLAWILHSPSLDIGVTWYRAILRALSLEKRPHVPPTVEMYLPDAPGPRCAVRVPVDRWEMTVSDVAGEALRVLTDEENADTPVKVRRWVGESWDRLQVAWRRGDRLWWVPAHANSAGGDSGACAYIVGPWFVAQSHVLELRLGPAAAACPPASSHDGVETALAEGYLLRRSIPGTTKLVTAALSIFSTWETRFAMQVGAHGRFLCLSRYPAPHAPLVVHSSPPHSPATANLTDAPHPSSSSGAQFYPIHPHPDAELTTLLTSTRIVDLLDIVRVHIRTPCPDCPSLFRAFRSLATHAAPGTPLVTLAPLSSLVTVPSTSPTAATFSLHTAPPTTKTKRIDRGCELAAGSHAGMHAWVTHACQAIVQVHRAQFVEGQMYARVLAHNQHVLARGVRGEAVDLVADARMWPRAGAAGSCTSPVLVAHPVDLKSTYRTQFRPALLIVTAAGDVLVCRRKVAVTSAAQAHARSASRRVSGVYWVARRVALGGGRAHVLVGYVNAKSGVSAVDEMWGEVVGRVWDEEGLEFAGQESSTDEEESDDEDETEADRVLDHQVSSPDVASSSTTPTSPPSPPGAADAAADHPPPITSWLPNTHPPVATVHEGPHQTCFTLWVPPRPRDVMKRRRRKGKVYVVECRRKAVRDQFLGAIQEVLGRAGK